MKININKIASILIIVALTAGNHLHAQQRNQQGSPPIPNASQIKTMVMKISDALVLNDVQSKQIYDLFIAHFKEVSTKIEASKPPGSEMEALKTKFENEVKCILTTDQQKQFKVFMKQSKPKHGPHHSHE